MGSLKSDFDNKLRTIVIVSNSTQFRQRFPESSPINVSQWVALLTIRRVRHRYPLLHTSMPDATATSCFRNRKSTPNGIFQMWTLTVRHLVRSPGNLQQNRKPRGPLFGLITTWWARYHVCPLLEPVSSLENSSLKRLRTELLNVCHCKPYKFRIARYHLWHSVRLLYL